MTAAESIPSPAATPTTALALVPATNAGLEAMTAEERAEIDRAVERIEHFPREFGWLLIYVGILGIVLPGVIGFPLVIAGGAVVMPGGRKQLSRLVGRNPGSLVRASLKQVLRMSDDIERRYPSVPKARS